jgi:biotin carboxylase
MNPPTSNPPMQLAGTADHLLVIPPNKAFTASVVAILKAAEKAGIAVTVLTTLAPSFFEAYPAVRAVVHLAEMGEDEATLAEVERAYAAAPFVRAVTFSEDHVELCAEINARLGLGGNTRRSAQLSRDKYRMRGALHAAGVPVPRFFAVRDEAEFAAAVAEVGYPCISKPVQACASEGVVKLEEGADLAAAFAFTSAVPQPERIGARVLVEEYVSGKEFSTEVVVNGGRAHVCGITDKTTEAEPFFGEIMHVFPAGLPEETAAEVRRVAQMTVTALEITDGGAHMEFRLSPRGPVVMECASRLPGDSLPIVIQMAIGVDLYECVLLQALGRDFSVEPRRARVGGIRFVQTEREGTLSAMEWDRERLSSSRGVVGWGTLREPGDFIARPPRGDTHRLGFLIAVAPTQDAVKQTLADGETALTFALS